MIMALGRVVVARVMRIGNVLKIGSIKFANALDMESEKEKT